MTRPGGRPVARPAFAGAAALLLGACGSGGGGQDGGGPGSGTPCDPAVEYCDAVPLSADPCGEARYWPLSLRSGQRPLVIHYSRLAAESKAAEALAVLENAWKVQVDELGFAAPLDDGGACGPDGAYDVFLWPGVDGAYVDSVAVNPATPHDDYSTYMAIDAFGDYGGEYFDTTLAHEFNHSVQASDDWWESPLIFEMTATFAEALVYPDQDDWHYTMEDFQARPQWSLFYDDAYRTWYMYGAAMFLHFLRERYYPADPAFIARTWHRMRSEPGDGRPDYLDALREILLAERGIELDSAVLEFARWRWFVDELDDGAHFADGADWPYTVARVEFDAASSSIALELGAMYYGAEYLHITNDGATDRRFDVQLDDDDPAVDWRLATVGGDDVLPGIAVPAGSTVAIVAVALPASPVSAAGLSFATHTASIALTAR